MLIIRALPTNVNETVILIPLLVQKGLLSVTRESYGSAVIECLTHDQGAAGSSLTGVN